MSDRCATIKNLINDHDLNEENSDLIFLLHFSSILMITIDAFYINKLFPFPKRNKIL